MLFLVGLDDGIVDGRDTGGGIAELSICCCAIVENESGIPTCQKMKFANIFVSRFGPDLEATALKTDLERYLHINIDSCVKLQTLIKIGQRCTIQYRSIPFSTVQYH